ncbi:MAG: glycosyltransferase [Thiotrichaceae bacterium]|nr:glycosyltransferase [Thiotrichaceae bacterium]
MSLRAFSQTSLNLFAQRKLADVIQIYLQDAQHRLNRQLNQCAQHHKQVYLDDFGLIPVYSLQHNPAHFQGTQAPIPALCGRIFSWRLQLDATCLPIREFFVQVGTGNRDNHCQLVLEIYQNNGLVARAALAGDNLQDNTWAKFTLDRALSAGQYDCHLVSPDSDNGNNTLFLWLTFPEKTLDAKLEHYQYPEADAESLQQRLDTLRNTPQFSVLLLALDKSSDYITCCLESIAKQIYPDWEIHLVHDETHHAVSQAFAKRFPKQVYLYPQFRPIPHAHLYQQLLDAVHTDYVVLLPVEDMLGIDALLAVAELLEIQQAEMIYSDDDCIDNTGAHSAPAFKPDWSPDWLKSANYCGNFAVYRTKTLQRAGGFSEFDDYPSLCWDVALRVSEQTTEIAHIPQILHHRRLVETPLPNVKVVQSALDRENLAAYAQLDEATQSVRVRYPVKAQSLVSIIIPTRDLAPVLLRCLSSLQQFTQYPHWEIVVVDNGSIEATTQTILNYYQILWGERFQVVRDDGEFNFSRLVNRGVQAARGDYILLLNNDTELLNPKNWLELMLGYAQLPYMGCVGAKLLYGDDTIQHAGVLCGVGGLANHGHRYFHVSQQGYLNRLAVVSNYSAVTGACLLVSREHWQQVGGFDEQLAVAFNDVDFCLKLSALGFRHVVLPQVLFYHHESRSRGLEITPEKQQRLAQEQSLMQQRWGASLQQDPFYNPHLTRTGEDFALAESSPYYI